MAAPAASFKEKLGLRLVRRYSTRMQELEEKIAHLTRTVEDLSDVVARQSNEIDALTHRVAMLVQREAERANDASSGGVIIGDERPPHY